MIGIYKYSMVMICIYKYSMVASYERERKIFIKRHKYIKIVMNIGKHLFVMNEVNKSSIINLSKRMEL